MPKSKENSSVRLLKKRNKKNKRVKPKHKMEEKKEEDILPLYVDDLVGGTRHMNDAEFGCYIRLLLAQFNRNGSLDNEPSFLKRYCTSFDSSWEVVREKFKEIGNNKIQNKRLYKEMQKAKKIIDEKNSLTELKPVVDRSIKKEVLPKEISESETVGVIEFISRINQKKLSETEVKNFWGAFLIHGEGEVYGNRARQLQHFRNWLKQQPQLNGKITDINSGAGNKKQVVGNVAPGNFGKL